jgi:hypothetical protein
LTVPATISSLMVRVRDVLGMPVPFATVVYTGHGGEVKTTTDHSGIAKLDIVPNGQGRLSTSLIGASEQGGRGSARRTYGCPSGLSVHDRFHRLSYHANVYGGGEERKAKVLIMTQRSYLLTNLIADLKRGMLSSMPLRSKI